MKLRIALSVLALGFLAAACQQKADTSATSGATPAASVAPAAPTPAPVAAGDDLPIEEDFEQQALDEINPQNLEQELDKLEKEITQ